MPCIVQLLSGSAELCVPETNTTVKPYQVGIQCCGEWLHACVQTQPVAMEPIVTSMHVSDGNY